MVYPKQPFAHFDRDVLVKRKEDPFNIEHPNNDKKKRVLAKVRSMVVNLNFNKLSANKHITTVQTRDVSSALLMLKQKRIDLFITDQRIAFNTINDLDIGDNLASITLSGTGAPIYLTFSKSFAHQNDIDSLMNRILNLNQQG